MRGMTTVQAVSIGAVAVLIIAADVFGISYLNNRTRDIQVLSEVVQIRSALESFRVHTSYYPRTEGPIALADAYAGTQKLCVEGFKSAAEKCTAIILAKVPDQSHAGYRYASVQDGADYRIQFSLNTTLRKFGFNKGAVCATSAGLTNQPCF